MDDECGGSENNKLWLLADARAEAETEAEAEADPQSVHSSFRFSFGSQAEAASELCGDATTVLLLVNVEDEREGAGDTPARERQQWRRLESLERSISPVAGALVRFGYAEIRSATGGFARGIDLFLIIC